MTDSHTVLTLQINGHLRTLHLSAPVSLADVLAELAIQPDRVAIELNGAIVSRSSWPRTIVVEGSRLEIVHFVGGGSSDGVKSA